MSLYTTDTISDDDHGHVSNWLKKFHPGLLKEEIHFVKLENSLLSNICHHFSFGNLKEDGKLFDYDDIYPQCELFIVENEDDIAIGLKSESDYSPPILSHNAIILTNDNKLYFAHNGELMPQSSEITADERQGIETTEYMMVPERINPDQYPVQYNSVLHLAKEKLNLRNKNDVFDASNIIQVNKDQLQQQKVVVYSTPNHFAAHTSRQEIENGLYWHKFNGFPYLIGVKDSNFDGYRVSQTHKVITEIGGYDTQCVALKINSQLGQECNSISIEPTDVFKKIKTELNEMKSFSENQVDKKDRCSFNTV